MTTNREPDPPAARQGRSMARSQETRPRTPDNSRSSGHFVVRLPGEIDVTNASRVHETLADALANGAAIVIADATRTTFCDCAGASALIGAHREAAASGTSLRVAAGPSMRRLFSLTGTDDVLDIYGTLAAAMTTRPAAAEQPSDISVSLSRDGHQEGAGTRTRGPAA